MASAGTGYYFWRNISGNFICLFLCYFFPTAKLRLRGARNCYFPFLCLLFVTDHEKHYNSAKTKDIDLNLSGYDHRDHLRMTEYD